MLNVCGVCADMNFSGKNLLDFSLDVGGTTHPGKIRKNNEDSYLMLNKQGCFAVSDGMGGGAAGEIASRMVVDAIRERLSVSGTSPASRERAVIRAAYQSNNDIDMYCSDHNFDSMGATLACLLLDSWDPGFAAVFHAGDSRVYRWRASQLEQLTNDHTLAAAENVEESSLPKDQQGVLTNVLGIASDFYLERLSCDVMMGDVFLLCTDGLYRMVPEESLKRILSQAWSVDASVTAQLLQAEALSFGGHDNCTVIVVKIHKTGECYAPKAWEVQEEMMLQEENIDDLSDTLPTEYGQ